MTIPEYTGGGGERRPTKVWLVWCSQGEYSDRSEWPLCAFLDEKHAQDDCERRLTLWRLADKTCRDENGEINFDADDGWWEKRNAAFDAIGFGSYNDEPRFYACGIDVFSAPLPTSPAEGHGTNTSDSGGKNHDS